MTAPIDTPTQANFFTRRISVGGSAIIFGYLALSIAVISIGIAFTEGFLRDVLGYLLLTIPILGFVPLSWLLLRKLEYRITQEGLLVDVGPAFRLSFIRPRQVRYAWKDIEDYLEDENLVLGKYGLLEIGLRVSPGTLRIMPATTKEEAYFSRFLAAFRQHVHELNSDGSVRAVEVATIKSRTTFFERPAAKTVSVALCILVVGLIGWAGFGQMPDRSRWQLAYIIFLLAVGTVYVARRAFVGRRAA
jgi:hypothetical protein